MLATGAVPRQASSLFSLEGWTDAKQTLIDESKKLKPWTFMLHPECTEDAVLSAPEAFDPKTDVGCLENIPLKELLTRKTIVPAADLSEVEIVDLFDALLAYQTMFMRSEPINNTLFTCTYLHDLSLVEGNKAVQAMCRGTLKAIDAVISAVVNADVRDGDEEFVPFTYDISPLSDDSVESVLTEIDAVIAGSGVSDALKMRLTLQRSLLAAVDGFSTVHQYKPDHPPAAKKKADADAKTAATATATATGGAAAASGADGDKKEAEAASSSESLNYYTKEELDAFRPKTDIPAVLKAFQSAVNAWHRVGNTEPQRSAKVFSKYAPLWLAQVSPGKQPELVSFASAKQFLKDFASNLTTINQWKNAKISSNWYIVLNSVKGLTASGAGVVARSIAMLFLYAPAVDLVLDQRSFPDVLLHTIDVVHGAPLYNHIFHDHHDVVQAVVQSKIDTLPENIRKGNKLQSILDNFKLELVANVREMVMTIAKSAFAVLHTLLRARGGCHRMLIHRVPELVELYSSLPQFEAAFFGVPAKQPQAQEPKTAKHFVLASFVTELLCEVVDTQLNNEVSLGLLSKPEVTAFSLIRHTAVAMRLENANSLFVDAASLASGATNKTGSKSNMKNQIDTFGAAHAYRQAKPAPLNVTRSLEVAKYAANCSFMVLAALAPVVPGFEQTELSLTSTATIFDNRFVALRRYLGPQVFPKHGAIIRSIEATAADPVKALTQASSLLEGVSSLLKKHIEGNTTGANQPLPITFAFDKICKHNLAIVKAAKGLIEASGTEKGSKFDLAAIFAEWTFDFEFVQGFPQLIRFTMVKKNQQ